MLSSLSMLSIILCSSLMMVAASPVASPNPASLKVLSLPKGFDKSHPALNYKAIAENLNANPNYKVPQLPSEVQALAQTFEFDVSSDFVECTTNIFSPDVGSVNIAIDRLRTQGQTYCCHNGGGFSTRMISYGCISTLDELRINMLIS